MNRYCYLATLLFAFFIGAAARGQGDLPSIVSAERRIFGKDSSVQASNFKGGEAKFDPASRLLKVTLTKPDAGVAVRCAIGSARLDPVPFLSDPNPAVEVVFREAGGNLPADLYVALEVFDVSTKPAIRKIVRTQTIPTASAENLPDGWKLMRFPFEKIRTVNAKDGPGGEWTRRIRTGDEKAPDISSDDTVERVQIWGSSTGTFEVSKISLVRMRNISVSVTNEGAKNLSKLEIAGQTAEPSAEVTLTLVDADGHAQSQKVRASDGKFQLSWENPPLTLGRSNELQACVGDGKNPLDQAIPKEVFGFLKDTSHVWLSVKGRDIVTSPLSKGGERPFYSVGAGYGKNVLVRGYDEEVATYAKSMGLNTLRLAFYNSNFNSRPDVPLTIEDITAFIDPVLLAAKRHDLYVILDEHSYFKNEIDEATARMDQKSASWTEERFNNWVKRWVQVATYYKDEPYILGYELCNEPVCDPETARKWYKRCIDAIREVDKKHIVIVGTHYWSHSRAMEATWKDVADKIDAPYNMAVFSFHDYPLDDNPWVVQSNLRAFQAKYNVPVMCTEFGAGGKPERVHREFQAGMLAMFAFDRVGWMIWSIYYDKTRATGYPTEAVRNTQNNSWEARLKNPGYWIPFVELWAPTARIMGTDFPQPASAGQ